MMSIRKLFEAATLNTRRAESPMSGVREYVTNRINTLKKAFAAGRMSQAAYTQQLAELQKNKNNKAMGTTQF